MWEMYQGRSAYHLTAPHTSARSSDCRFYKKSKKEVIAEQLVGNNVETFVRKVGLRSCLSDHMDEPTEEIFINNIHLLVKFMRERAIKFMLFVHYFILAKLEVNKQEEDFTLPVIYFCADFFKSCQQLVCGNEISKNEKLKGNENH